MEKLVVGDHRFLRNDYPCKITVGQLTFSSVEHAFQAVKLLDPDLQQKIADTSSVADAISIGRDRNNEIWDDWDRGRSLRVMEYLVRQKFFTDENLIEQLVETGDKSIEMQRPGDSYWGIGNDGNGENHLGHILMHIRDELQMLRGWKPPEKKEPEPGDWLRDLHYEDGELNDDVFNLLVELYEKCKEIPESADNLAVSYLRVDGIIPDIRELVEKIDEQHDDAEDSEDEDDDEDDSTWSLEDDERDF